MADTQTETTGKQFLNAAGLRHLWSKIKDRYDSKLDSIAAGDNSVSVSDGRTVTMKVSSAAGNAIHILDTYGAEGVFVSEAEDADTYTLTQLGQPSAGASASYKLQRYVHGVGPAQDIPGAAVINIPTDMVVTSGTVETKTSSGVWGPPGTYLHLVLANATQDNIYINVSSLIEYVTSGSTSSDMVQIAIDPGHHVTASILDGSITRAKLYRGVVASLDRADTSVQSVTAGTANGSIKVNGQDIAVTGLGSAAFANTSAFDAAGTAAGVRTELIGSLGDMQDDINDVQDEVLNKLNDVTYDSDAGKLTSVKNGTATDIVTVDTLKQKMAFGNSAFRDVTDITAEGVPASTDTNLVTGRTVYHAISTVTSPDPITDEQIDALFA